MISSFLSITMQYLGIKGRKALRNIYSLVFFSKIWMEWLKIHQNNSENIFVKWLLTSKCKTGEEESQDNFVEIKTSFWLIKRNNFQWSSFKQICLIFKNFILLHLRSCFHQPYQLVIHLSSSFSDMEAESKILNPLPVSWLVWREAK